jgi:phosphoglycolate phosphatase-like HAD superfamily hydrolase
MRKLVLFDIDGTLLHTHGAGRRAIHAAFAEEFGAAPPDDVVRFDGKTDPQIVRELLQVTHHPGAGDVARIGAVCRRYVELLAAELAQPDHATTVYPGVVALLDRLDARGDALLGLLTGNLADGARLKLESGGIPYQRFRVGAFGSDHADRGALPAIAVQRAAVLMGRVPQGPEIVILGDTPADITCGDGVAARAIGVATGSYDGAALTAAGAYAVFDDLSEPDRVLTAIYT